MKVFISWSGDLSHKVALVISDWLENVIQIVKCFVSSEDIDKGSRWFPEISNELESSKFGIICITRENMNAPWILFEAGALSKIIDRSQVCPLLIDVSPTDLTGPLVQFQSTHPLQDKDEMFKLIKTINNKMGDEALKEEKVEKSFNQWWEKYLEELKPILSKVTKDKKISKVERKEREILEEILILCRNISQEVSLDNIFLDTKDMLVSKNRPSLRNTEFRGGLPLDDKLKVSLKEVFDSKRPDNQKLRGIKLNPNINVTILEDEDL
jgi:hypothetical protein